jgi:hypothetical protein
MKEMLMLLAATMSRHDIVERLTESCEQYNEAELLGNADTVKEAENEIFVNCNLFIMNFVNKGDIKEAIKSIKTMEEIERAHKFFQTDKN